MENASEDVKMESIKAFQSAIHKSEAALANMAQKGANTALMKKRLHALGIGLAVLENTWNQKTLFYSLKDLAEARPVLAGLLPSIENIQAKSKAGSPQKTLLERRITALKLAVQAIDHFEEGRFLPSGSPENKK